MLGERLKQAIRDAGISYAKAALEIGVSEGNLYNLFKKESFEVSYLLKASQLLNLPLSYFLEGANVGFTNTQPGALDQAGNNNTQKAKGAKAQAQSQAVDLDQCLRDNEALKRELEVTRALVEAKEESLRLLRAMHNRLN